MKIFGKTFVFAALFLGLFSASAFALKTDNEIIKNEKIFGITFPDESSFYAKTALVASISKNEYIVAKALFVTEITISIEGSPNNVRIYHAMPMDSAQFEKLMQKRFPQSAVEKMAAAFSGVQAAKEHPMLKNNMQDIKKLVTLSTVHKDYPVTTHSKNLEFAVLDLEELLRLYDRLYMDFTGATKKLQSSDSTAPNASSKSSSDDKLGSSMNGRMYIVEAPKDNNK